jgi:hypothetical protein
VTAYRNFTVDFPARVAQLDAALRSVAADADLEVSYLVMKLAATFLLPYERLQGTSGAARADVSDRQRIRRTLQLDKRWHESDYCSDLSSWALFHVSGFHRGPRDWSAADRPLNDTVAHELLKVVRHSIAHSNLFFGGEQRLEHIHIGSRLNRDDPNGPYVVLRGTIGAVDHLVSAWLGRLRDLRASPSVIWQEIEIAA